MFFESLNLNLLKFLAVQIFAIVYAPRLHIDNRFLVIFIDKNRIKLTFLNYNQQKIRLQNWPSCALRLAPDS